MSKETVLKIKADPTWFLYPNFRQSLAMTGARGQVNFAIPRLQHIGGAFKSKRGRRDGTGSPAPCHSVAKTAVPDRESLKAKAQISSATFRGW